MMFSVIIPAYNRSTLLEQALASVWTQEFEDYEVIVVDDGSADGTMEMLLGQQRNHPELKVIHQTNAGPGAARNRGAREATGEYLAFLDSDDIWFPWTLKTFADALEEDLPIAVVCGHLLPFVSRDEIIAASTTPLKLERFTCYGAAAGKGCYAGSGMIAVRRSSFLNVGGFTTEIRNSEDHDLMLRLTDVPGYVEIAMPFTLGRRLDCAGLTSDYKHSFQGILHLIKAEQAGRYPGGNEWRANRRLIIAQHCRSAILGMLQTRHSMKDAWYLYGISLYWQIVQRRWKFLLGFPLHALFSLR